MKVVRPEEVGLDPALAYKSSPSGGRELLEIVRALDYSPSGCALDIGCGKGSAIRTLLRCGFARVDGLELSPGLAQIARRNFSRLRERRTTIFTGDATDFEQFDSYDFYYLYNPFPGEVLEGCVSEIVSSMDRRPRRTHILYLNSVHDEQIAATGRFDAMAHRRNSRGYPITFHRSTDADDR